MTRRAAIPPFSASSSRFIRQRSTQVRSPIESPITSDVTLIKDTINSYAAKGRTAGQLGIA